MMKKGDEYMLAQEKSTILFVDDDVESLRLYKRKFDSDYVVWIAASGIEALEIVRNKTVDIVVSDLRMPEMDGLFLLQRLKEINPRILRVIMTAYDDYEWIVEGLNSGIISHSFKKPLNDKYLKLIVDEFLETKRIKHSNQEMLDSMKLYSKELSDRLRERTDELKEAYRLLDESDRRYKYAIKAVKQGILDWGILEDQLVLNDVFLENLGYDRSDIVIRSLEDLKNYIHPDQRDEFFEALKQHMKSGNRMEMRVQLMGKFGEYVWLNFIGLVVEWDQKNRPVRFIGSCIDIMNQINLENELIQMNHELKMINETKRNFIANVSHELRTPMNSILGFSSLYKESDKAEIRLNYVEHIKRSANTLNKVIEDMLEFSSINEPILPSEMNNFKLDQFLHELGSEIYENVVNKNLEFSMKIDWEFPFYLIGYEALLKRTIMAILDNAVKFTEEGLIELKVNKVRQEGEVLTLEFLVTDTGVGINKQEQDYLFKAFNQLDGSSTRAYDGLGLGLSIALEHIKAMGGKIEIESEVNHGTKVAIQVPFRVASEVKRLQMKLLDNEKYPVVFYDPYVDIADELEDMLQDLGFPVYRVSDVIELKATLDKRSGVDFVLSCQKALGEIHPYVSVDRHIVIGINNFSSDRVEGWIHGSVKKPVIATELYNVLMASLVKHHPNIVENEMEINVPVKAIEAIEDVRILVVEDSAMNRKIMENILNPVRVQVTFAEDGQTALAIKDLESYDMVFMDIHLPDIDGDEVCRQYRLRPELKGLPIIGLTAESDIEKVNRYKMDGMNDVLHKPYNVEQIYRTIEQYASSPLGKIEEDKDNVGMALQLDACKSSDIDMESGLKRLNGNLTVYMSLLENFIEEYGDWSAKSLHDGDNLTNLKFAYHTLKGLAGNLGATELHCSVKALEEKVEQDINSISEDDIMLVDTALKAFLDVAQKFVQSVREEDIVEVDAESLYSKSEISEIMMDLSKDIKNYDTIVLDKLAALDCRRFGEPICGQLKKVNKAIQNFEFDQALSYIEAIQESLKR